MQCFSLFVFLNKCFPMAVQNLAWVGLNAYVNLFGKSDSFWKVRPTIIVMGQTWDFQGTELSITSSYLNVCFLFTAESCRTMMCSPRPTITVIGGGVSGQVCAPRTYQLVGFNVEKYDPRERNCIRCINIDSRVTTSLSTLLGSSWSVTSSLLRLSGSCMPRMLWKYVIALLWDLCQGMSQRKWLDCRCLPSCHCTCYVGLAQLQALPSRTQVWKNRRLIAHHGKCADRLSLESKVPEIHTLLKVKFGLVLGLKAIAGQFWSLWVLPVAFPDNLGLGYEGAFVEHLDVSWSRNNVST